MQENIIHFMYLKFLNSNLDSLNSIFFEMIHTDVIWWLINHPKKGSKQCYIYHLAGMMYLLDLGQAFMYGWSVPKSWKLHWNGWNKQNSTIYFSFVPKWMKYGWLLRPHFLSSTAFHPTDPYMEVRPYSLAWLSSNPNNNYEAEVNHWT